MNNVQIIAPTKVDSIFDKDLSESRVKRVAAYCRVSTDSEEQSTSFNNQIEEWTKRILENPDYQLVKVYADEGISGTSAKGRNGFNQMIKDAKAGKIDLILVKSISRFARNTVLTIQTIRELKEIGVEVYFDNERLSTFDAKNEFMFSIISSMAQEESRHISENVTWTVQKKMREGVPFVAPSNFMGYDLSEDKKQLIINEEQAKVVRLIFDLYDSGKGPDTICRELRKRGIKTMTGRTKWNNTTVLGMLRNEKYMGDLLLQKTYTVDYLTHKRRENKGQRQKYKVEGAHEPIISIEQWNRVQARLKSQSAKAVGKNRDLSKYNTKHPLSGMIICYGCGAPYKRRTWYKGYPDGQPKIMFQCNTYIYPTKTHRCHSKPLSENMILRACADIINKLYIGNTNAFNKLSKALTSTLSEETDVDEELNRLLEKKSQLNGDIDFLLKERAAANTVEMRKTLDTRYQDLVNDYQNIVAEIQRVQDKTVLRKETEVRLSKMIDILKGKEITYKMLTKEMMDCFFYRIIAVDKHEIVVTINASNKITLDKFRESRQAIAALPSILDGYIKCKDPFKTQTLAYKVVVL